MRPTRARASSLALAAALASVVVVAVACTTDLGSAAQASIGRSRLLGATSAKVVTMVEGQGVIAWFDAAANVFTCPSAGCEGKATLLTSTSTSPSYPAAIAAGQLYWAAGSNLYRCALSGCPDGPELVLAAASEIVRIVTDGTTLAWADKGPTITLCSAADCKPHGATSSCSEDRDCPAERPTCGIRRQCVICDEQHKAACRGATPVCGSDGTCVGCDETVGPTCGTIGRKACDPQARTCEFCVAQADCDVGSGRSFACVAHACVPCGGDYGSGKANACAPEQPVCAGGTCGPCDATTCGAPNQCRVGGCLTPCAGPGNCDAAHTCQASFCFPKQPLGAECSTAGDCLAGTCAAGRCGADLGGECTKDDECASGVCFSDKKCGVPTGAACFAGGQCRTGACFGRVCTGPAGPSFDVAKPIPWTLLVAGGRLYYSVQAPPRQGQTTSIVSCAVGECPAGTATVYSPEAGTVALLLGGDAKSLFFGDGLSSIESDRGVAAGALFRCALPGCTAPVAMGGAAASRVRVDVAGNDLYVHHDGTSAITRCTRDGCADSPPELLPDPQLATSNTGTETLGAHPFAVDPTATYWATSTIFGTPGNLVIATPR